MKIKYSYVDMLMRFEAGAAKEPGGMHVAELMGDKKAMLAAALDRPGLDQLVFSGDDWDCLTDILRNPPDASGGLKRLMREYRDYKEKQDEQD